MDKLCIHNFDPPFHKQKIPIGKRQPLKRGSLVYLSSRPELPSGGKSARADVQQPCKNSEHRATYYRSGDQFLDNLLSLPALTKSKTTESKAQGLASHQSGQLTSNSTNKKSEQPFSFGPLGKSGGGINCQGPKRRSNSMKTLTIYQMGSKRGPDNPPLTKEQPKSTQILRNSLEKPAASKRIFQTNMFETTHLNRFRDEQQIPLELQTTRYRQKVKDYQNLSLQWKNTMRFKFGAGPVGQSAPKIVKKSGEKQFVLDGWEDSEAAGLYQGL